MADTTTPSRIWLSQFMANEYPRVRMSGHVEYLRADLHAAAITELVEGLRSAEDSLDFAVKEFEARQCIPDYELETMRNRLEIARALIAKYGDKTND